MLLSLFTLHSALGECFESEQIKRSLSVVFKIIKNSLEHLRGTRVLPWPAPVPGQLLPWTPATEFACFSECSLGRWHSMKSYRVPERPRTLSLSVCGVGS